MPINPPKKVTGAQKVGAFAKDNQSVLWFLAGLLLGYAFGWPV